MSKVLVSFPDKFIEQVDAIAEAEMRTRSEFIREALRMYIKALEAEKQGIIL